MRHKVKFQQIHLYILCDIDILIDFHAGQETYLNFMDACSILQSAFGKTKLDVVTKKGLSPYIGETILKEVEYV